MRLLDRELDQRLKVRKSICAGNQNDDKDLSRVDLLLVSQISVGGHESRIPGIHHAGEQFAVLDA